MEERLVCYYCEQEIEDEDDMCEENGVVFHIDCLNDYYAENEILDESQYQSIAGLRNAGEILGYYYYESDFNALYNFVRDYDYVRDTLFSDEVQEYVCKKISMETFLSVCEELNRDYRKVQPISWRELILDRFEPELVSYRMFSIDETIGKVPDEIFNSVLSVLRRRIWDKVDLYYTGEQANNYFEVYDE